MKIIKAIPCENGARPALQDWRGKEAPSGYAWCPDEFVDVFYSTTPAGFVDITIEKGTVVAMTVNEEALAEYIAGLPEPTEREPSDEEVLNTILGEE